MQLMVVFGEHLFQADVLDISPAGVGLRLPVEGPLPAVDCPLRVTDVAGAEGNEVNARVRHCTMAPDGHEYAIVGVAMSPGSAAPFLRLGESL